MKAPVPACSIEQTTLEACRIQLQENASDIANIGNRISLLLQRLSGPSPCGMDAGDVELTSGGLIHDHLADLERQAQDLGAIRADLTALERLL